MQNSTLKLDDLLNESPSFSSFLERPYVMWPLIATVSSIVLFALFQTEAASKRIAAYTGADVEVRMANAPSSHMPAYSADLALIQNQLERTQAEFQKVVAARSEIEQKMALLENKFADVTGSVEKIETNIAQTKPSAHINSTPQSFEHLPKMEVITPAHNIPTLDNKSKPHQIETSVSPSNPSEELKSAFNHVKTAPEMIKPTEIVENISKVSTPVIIQKSAIPIPPIKPFQRAQVEMPPKAEFATHVAAKQAELNQANMVTGSIEPKANIAMTTPTRTLFAISMGETKNLSDAKSRWNELMKGNDSILAGMDPYVSIEEKNKATQLKLLTGPFRNAQDATSICGQLTQNGVYCTVSVFNGQKLQ